MKKELTIHTELDAEQLLDYIESLMQIGDHVFMDVSAARDFKKMNTKPMKLTLTTFNLAGFTKTFECKHDYLPYL